MPLRKRWLAGLCLVLLGATGVRAQKQPPAAPAAPLAPVAPNAEFLQAADSVLADMSKLLSLPVLEPLKKSVRSREQIRAYLVANMREDKDKKKRYADRKALEAFGLIPKGYPLEQKLLALLTEQIAGLYDPKRREFFIADWTNPADQRVIMAHELTHALEDQHFHVQKWEDGAKPNDDGVLARDAVLEGSATVAMMAYFLYRQLNVSDAGDKSLDLDTSLLIGDPKDSPELAKAPMVIRDELLFPYISGASFVQQVLKAWNGWPDLHKVFENPPASTQQILHPELYLRGVTPAKVKLSPLLTKVPHGWKKLDENALGEFGVNEVLKRYLGEKRADALSPSWRGDRYAVLEHGPDGRILLVVRLRLASEQDAVRFFDGYSKVLEMKDEDHTALVQRPDFFSLETPEGGAFLRCRGEECVSVEGTTREVFEAMTSAMGWPAEPVEVPAGGGGAKTTAEQQTMAPAGVVAGPPAGALLEAR